MKTDELTLLQLFARGPREIHILTPPVMDLLKKGWLKEENFQIFITPEGKKAMKDELVNLVWGE